MPVSRFMEVHWVQRNRFLVKYANCLDVCHFEHWHAGKVTFLHCVYDVLLL